MKRIKFFVPVQICKSGDGESSEFMDLEGIASSTDEDTDKETLNPKGYNLKPFLNYGFVNWDHKTKEDPLAVIGEPLEARITTDNKLYVKVRLYNDSAKARKVYELAHLLEKNSPTGKRLGFSIEGVPKQVDPLNPKRILTADITGLAVTANPKNKNTFASIVKGEYSEDDDDSEDSEEDVEILKMMDTGSMSPQTKESLEGSPLNKEELLSKSQIYSLIGEKLSLDSPEILKSVYNFLETNKMKDKDNIERTLTELQEKISIKKSETKESETKEEETTLEKSEETTTLETPEVVIEKSESSEEEGETIEKSARSCYKDGMNENSLSEELIRKGYSLTDSMTISKSVVSEMNEKKQGGDIQKLSEPSQQMLKSEVTQILEGFTTTLDSKLLSVIETFGTIIKSQGSNIESLTETISEIKQSNEELVSRLTNQPVGRKSTVTFSERFPNQEIKKSEDESKLDSYDLGTKLGRESLCDMLLEKSSNPQILEGQRDILLKAVPSIEISGNIPAHLKPSLEKVLRELD